MKFDVSLPNKMPPYLTVQMWDRDLTKVQCGVHVWRVGLVLRHRGVWGWPSGCSCHRLRSCQSCLWACCDRCTCPCVLFVVWCAARVDGCSGTTASARCRSTCVTYSRRRYSTRCRAARGSSHRCATTTGAYQALVRANPHDPYPCNAFPCPLAPPSSRIGLRATTTCTSLSRLSWPPHRRLRLARRAPCAAVSFRRSRRRPRAPRATGADAGRKSKATIAM